MTTPDLLASTADLAAKLQVSVGDLDADAALITLQAATAVVQGIVGQRLVQVVDDPLTIDLDPFDQRHRYIELPERPVTAVSSVAIGTTPVTDYTVQLTRGRVYRPDGWRNTLLDGAAPSTVTVIYTHGYPPDSQKIQLARSATLTFAVGAYENPSGVTREQIDDYQVAYADTVAGMNASPFLVLALLKAYGRPVRSAQLIR